MRRSSISSMAATRAKADDGRPSPGRRMSAVARPFMVAPSTPSARSASGCAISSRKRSSSVPPVVRISARRSPCSAHHAARTATARGSGSRPASRWRPAGPSSSIVPPSAAPSPARVSGVERGVPAVHRRKAESKRGRRFRHQLGRRSRGEDSPVVHHDHVVCQALDVRELVRGQEDRPSGRPQVADERADGRLRLRVHSRGRLVEHQELRSPDEGQGEGQPLSLAAREELAAPSRRVGQPQQLEQRRRDRPARRRGGRGAGRARAAGRRA